LGQGVAVTSRYVKTSKRVPLPVYADYVKAKVSLLLERHWHPSNLDQGYIEHCWQDGRNPDGLAEELADDVKKE